MVEKILKNNKGSSTVIWFFVSIIIFISIQALIIDFGNIYQGQLKLKRVVDLSSKAGALIIKEGEELAEGNFIIKEDEAKAKTIDYLAKNLNLQSVPTIIDGKEALIPESTSILNNPLIIEEFIILNTAGEYTSSLMNKTYQVQEPSTLLTISYSFKGLILNRNFKMGKLASSQLTSLYD